MSEERKWSEREGDKERYRNRQRKKNSKRVIMEKQRFFRYSITQRTKIMEIRFLTSPLLSVSVCVRATDSMREKLVSLGVTLGKHVNMIFHYLWNRLHPHAHATHTFTVTSLLSSPSVRLNSPTVTSLWLVDPLLWQRWRYRHLLCNSLYSLGGSYMGHFLTIKRQCADA